METIDANGSRLTPMVLQFGWGRVPMPNKDRVRALLSDATLTEMLGRKACMIRDADGDKPQLIDGVPIMVHNIIARDQVLFADVIDGTPHVLIKNLWHWCSFVSAGARCKGCSWHMSITETERGNTYCNRCEDQLWTKFAAALRNTATMSVEESVLTRERYNLLPMPPNVLVDYLHPYTFCTRKHDRS